MVIRKNEVKYIFNLGIYIRHGWLGIRWLRRWWWRKYWMII